MFPYDDSIYDFDTRRVQQFDTLIASYGFPWKLRQIRCRGKRLW